MLQQHDFPLTCTFASWDFLRQVRLQADLQAAAAFQMASNGNGVKLWECRTLDVEMDSSQLQALLCLSIKVLLRPRFWGVPFPFSLLSSLKLISQQPLGMLVRCNQTSVITPVKSGRAGDRGLRATYLAGEVSSWSSLQGSNETVQGPQGALQFRRKLWPSGD